MTGSLFFPLESLSFNTISTTKRLPESPGELFFPRPVEWSLFSVLMSIPPIHSQEEAHFCSSAMLYIARKNKPFKSPFIPELTSQQRQHPLQCCKETQSLRGLSFSHAQQFPPKIPSAVTVDQWTIPCFRESRFRLKILRQFWDTRVQAPLLICSTTLILCLYQGYAYTWCLSL